MQQNTNFQNDFHIATLNSANVYTQKYFPKTAHLPEVVEEKEPEG